MEHLKTFENYQPLNEENLIEDLKNLPSKIGKFFKNWKDKEKKKAAQKILKAVQEKKDDPKMKEALNNLKEKMSKLSEEDKNKIMKKLKSGNIPEIEIDEVSENKVKDFINKKIIRKVLETFGAGAAFTGIATPLFIMIKTALGDISLQSEFMSGLTAGEFAGIAAIVLVSTGIIASTAGKTMKDAEVKKSKK